MFMEEVILDSRTQDVYGSHLEILNNLFGQNYKSHQKATFRINDSTIVWFPKMIKDSNGIIKSNRSGWINEYNDDYSVVTAEAPNDLIEEKKVPKITLIFAMLNPHEYTFLGAFQRAVSVENERKLIFNRLSRRVKLVGKIVNTIELLENENNDRKYWIFPCNINQYDVYGAFEKYHQIYWRQHLTKVKKGDGVFIYVGKPSSRLAFYCDVIDTDIPKENALDIDDSEFYKSNLNDCKKYYKIELKEVLYDRNISIDKLREYGLLGNIQNQREISGKVLLSVLEKINCELEIGDSGEIVDPNIPYVHEEGEKKQRFVSYYERDSTLRKLCIKKYGCICQVCGIKLEDIYGKIAEGFIHVHHIKPISEFGYKHETDAVKDLVPVCPNCHAMLHKTLDGISPSIQELKNLIRISKIKNKKIKL